MVIEITGVNKKLGPNRLFKMSLWERPSLRLLGPNGAGRLPLIPAMILGLLESRDRGTIRLTGADRLIQVRLLL